MADQTVTLRPPVWALLAAVTIGGCFYLGGKHLELRHRNDVPSSVSVSGEGKVQAVPDIAELSFGVRMERVRTAKEAMERLGRDMTAVVEAVRKTGVEEKDIATEQLSLSPSYDYSAGRQQLVGYEASQSLRVKVRNLDQTSGVLSAATSAGANQAGDVRFTIDDPEALRERARAEAIQEATQKAAVLATQLGVRLGELKGYAEDRYGSPQPPVMMARGLAESDAGVGGGTPLPAGEQEVVVNVTLTYQLGD